MDITVKDICKNCELGLKRSDCSNAEFQECYEEKSDLITFKKNLNSNIQRLGLDKNEVIKILDEIYR